MVIWVRYASFFCSWLLQHIRPYVISFCLSSGICFCFTKNMVSVIIAKHLISILNDLLHVALYFGYLMRCRYSRRSPVLLLSTALAKLHRNCSGYCREDACSNHWKVWCVCRAIPSCASSIPVLTSSFIAVVLFFLPVVDQVCCLRCCLVISLVPLASCWHCWFGFSLPLSPGYCVRLFASL